MQNTVQSDRRVLATLTLLTVGGLVSTCPAGQTSPSVTAPAAAKPAWLTDLSLGLKESYDDNLLGVSGSGLTPRSSWITTVAPKVGLNFMPFVGKDSLIKTLSLNYAPEFNIYHDDSDESYNSHPITLAVKAASGPATFSLDNAALYIDGNDRSPLYALNQISGAAGNQLDKNRSFYGQGRVRERRQQFQDRANTSLQYKWDHFFARPTASLTYYDLMTHWQKASIPYAGYQNWPDRYDVNGGIDFGYYLAPKLAVTLGYRYGHQWQEALPPSIDSTGQSSNDYQRMLVGLEGELWPWLKVKIAGGPDFRDYNPTASVNDRQPVKYYGEAALNATLPHHQTLAFNYKQYQWVSATGKVPYFDSQFSLSYHWSVTKKIGLDLLGRISEADYTTGAGSSSLRDDRQYTLSAGVTYAFDAHWSTTVAYTYDQGNNVLDDLPASQAAPYRNFNHQLATVGFQYKF